MKKKLLCLCILFSLSIPSFAVLKTWIGASGGNWSTNSNWSPLGSPSSVDDAVVNTAVTIVLDVNPTINSLLISATGTVTFSASAARTILLSSTSTTIPGVQINAGAMLRLAPTAAVGMRLSLTNNIGVTGKVYGTLLLAGTVVNATPNLELFTGAAANGNMIVYDGGIIQYDVNSGNTVGNGLTGLQMESGSQYIVLRNGGVLPAGSYKNGSTIKIQGVTTSLFSFNTTATYEGVIEWNCPSQTINSSAASLGLSSSYPTIDSFIVKSTGSSGTLRLSTEMAAPPSIRYLRVEGGILQIASPRTVAISMTITNDITITGGTLLLNATDATDLAAVYNTSVNVNGNVTITGGTLNLSNRPNGTIIVPPFPSWGTGNINCKGNFLQSGGLITETATDPPVSDDNIINLDGTILQNLQLTNWINRIRLAINNATNGVHIQNNIICPSRVWLSSTINGSYLSLGNFNFTVTYPNLLFSNGGGLYSRFITNGMGKVNLLSLPATTSQVIQLAHNTSTYNPLTIASLSTAITNNYSVRVENGNNPSGVFNTNRTINRTWIINATSSIISNSVNLSFGYAATDANPSCTPTAAMELGHFIAPSWNLDPVGISRIPTVTPYGYSVGAYAPIALDSAFILGNVGSILNSSSSLLLKVKQTAAQVVLSWQNTNGSFSNYDVQFSTDGKTFTTIEKNTFLQNYTTALLGSVNYYRIKAIDALGKITYSNTIALVNESKGIFINKLSPNPVSKSGTAVLQIASAQKNKVRILCTDILGRRVHIQINPLIVGNNEIPINLNKLNSGIYQLTIVTDDNKSMSLQFVKE